MILGSWRGRVARFSARAWRARNPKGSRVRIPPSPYYIFKGVLMKKLMTCVSARLLLGFSFIVSLFIFGSMPAVKAEDTQSLEGEWAVQSSWDSYLTGGKFTITRKGDEYKVIVSSPQIQQSTGTTPYYGTPTQIMATMTLDYDDLVYAFPSAPEQALKQLVGKVTERHRITLSSDGRSAECDIDHIRFWNNQEGNMVNYEVIPFDYKTTLSRISKSVSDKETGASAFAQVESRGEFYFLTKDGRKVTGEEASKVPLEEGTKVVTGNDGHIKMTLPDNTTFIVGPNSDLVIDKFVYDSDKSPEKIMATMTKGVFRWVTGKTAQHDPEQMKVNLPVVAVGIRGTDFEATVAPDGSGSVVLNFGRLEITEKKTGFTFILNAGEKITFGADGSVSRPMKVQ